MDEALLPIASELWAIPAFDGENPSPKAFELSTIPFFDGGTYVPQLMHEIICSLRQEVASYGASGHDPHEHPKARLLEFCESQLKEIARVGTNRQGSARYRTEPSEKRVMGLEPTTFTLAT